MAAACLLSLAAHAAALEPLQPAAALEPVVGGPGGDLEWAQRLSKRLHMTRTSMPISAAALLADWQEDREKFQLNATSHVLTAPSAGGMSSLGALPKPFLAIERKNLTIAVLQMQAEHGRVNESMAKATQLIAEGPEGPYDLLVLPELAFSGYIWDNPEHALTVAETARGGPTFLWASRVAAERNAHVLVGFVERDEDRGTLHNSAMVVSPQATLLAVARKTALTNTDSQWATPGSGSKSMPVVDLPGVARIGVGICKDLSAVPQHALPGEHVLDDSFRAAAVDVIAVLAAWDSTDSQEVVHGKWMARVGKHLGTQTLLVVADQSGFEMGTPYAGSSTIMDLSGPTKLAALSEVAEGVAVHHVVNYPMKAMAGA